MGSIRGLFGLASDGETGRIIHEVSFGVLLHVHPEDQWEVVFAEVEAKRDRVDL